MTPALKTLATAAGPGASFGQLAIPGELAIADDARGLVVFADGSGREGVENRRLAERLRERGFSTLLVNLPAQDAWGVGSTDLRFDPGVLARRMMRAIAWLARSPRTRQLPVGYFGAGPAAAAVLVAAANRPASARAIVCRGGRPDLAGAALTRVRAPTLLIAAGADPLALALNRRALKQLRCDAQLQAIAGVTNLAADHTALGEVARLSVSWFEKHLCGHAAPIPAAG